MGAFNPMYFLLARSSAGKHVPSKRRSRAALLGVISGDPIGAIVAGRRARAEFERDVLAGEEEVTLEQIRDAPRDIQEALAARMLLTQAVRELRAAPDDKKDAARKIVLDRADALIPERRAGNEIVVRVLAEPIR